MTRRIAAIFVCSLLASIILIVLAFFREQEQKAEWYESSNEKEVRELLRECREHGGSTLITIKDSKYVFTCLEDYND
jgi:ribosomal protein S27AE